MTPPSAPGRAPAPATTPAPGRGSSIRVRLGHAIRVILNIIWLAFAGIWLAILHA